MSAVPFLAGWTLRSAAILLAGAASLRLLRVKDPRVRLAVWIATLCGSLVMPALSAALADYPLAIVRVAMPSVAMPQGDFGWMSDASDLTVPGRAGGASREKSSIVWPNVVLTVYLWFVALLLLRLCVGLAMGGALRRRCRATGRWADANVILESDEVSGPVTLGILRPVIVLPADWRDWPNAKLQAVLAHERSHIERRDSIVQVVSTIHRALLWHSPVSWYLHRAIVRAGEEASDDAAVQVVQDRASYAELLLDFMQRGARRPHWHGVAMARYGTPEARIGRILDGTEMSRGITRRGIAAMLAIGCPFVALAAAAHLESSRTYAMGSARRLTFSTASIVRSQPGSRGGPVRPLAGGERYVAGAATLKLMISLMYKAPIRQITGGPAWMETEPYDVDARADRARSLDELHAMFQNLLADRFQLRFHRETKPGPRYALTRDGAKLKMNANDGAEQFTYPVAFGPDGVLIASRVSMQYFSWWLGESLLKDGRPVIDRTGLQGNYDFRLAFAPKVPSGVPRDRIPPAVLARPPLVDALRDQLGLQLRAEDGPVEYFVIDHVERPAGN